MAIRSLLVTSLGIFLILCSLLVTTLNKKWNFEGDISTNRSQNPDFFNWNKVKIRYCDGASFSGHPEAEFKAILTGCSAGGLATLIHCDYFRDHLPKNALVKCFSDGGFFLNVLDVLGNPTMRSFFHDVVSLQGVDKSLDQKCVAKTEPSKCMFPQYFLKNIRTPVFLVNAAYGYWQIQNELIGTRFCGSR